MRLLVLVVTSFSITSTWGFFTAWERRSTRPFGRVALQASNSDEINPMKPGSTVALITPMTNTGDIDVPSLRKLLQLHVAEGTDNLCVLGTTGEASVMTMNEREKVLKVVVEEAKGKIPILVGTGTIDPNNVKAMTQQAIDLGCDANLVVCPYYVKPPQRALISHMTTMADMELPLVIYNIPGRTGIDLKDENIAICAEHENIIGLKDATGDLSRVASMRKLLAGDDFLMYSGDDATSMEFVNLGGDGCISVTANLAPGKLHEIMIAAKEGRTADAEAANKPLELLHDKLFVEANPMPAKWCAQRMGLIETAHARPPLCSLDPAYEPELIEALQAAGLI
uniref:4-hydroxy-tetrahydrodipicolinate synthase n=1 Tax=Grammatophora oceanica TaxID=210454 RepID=A0A7S1VS73_9STRA|mmetsp:Transcript_577/g.781  ORF Transcript_577/g.781 Transcript_577/m.781 type:complete len:339 (+) Transcript_577:2-1018(+)